MKFTWVINCLLNYRWWLELLHDQYIAFVPPLSFFSLLFFPCESCTKMAYCKHFVVFYNNLCIRFGTCKVFRMNHSRSKIIPKSKFPAKLVGKNGSAVPNWNGCSLFRRRIFHTLNSMYQVRLMKRIFNWRGYSKCPGHGRKRWHKKIKPVQLKLDKITDSEYLRTQVEKIYLVYAGLFLSDFNILVTDWL